MSRFPVTNLIRYDLEVYPNYFLAGFQLPSGEVYQYQFLDGDLSHLPGLKEFILWAQSNGYTFAGFNSKHYDDPVLSEFLMTPTNEVAYRTSCRIIVERVPPWEFANVIESIDLMQVLPGRIGLKKIGVCLGHHKLQELPFDPHQKLTPEQAQQIASYNVNDLEITGKLVNKVQEELDLRQMMSDEYNVDVRSKGEAAIAEVVLTSEYAKLGGPQARVLKEQGRAHITTQPWVQVSPPGWWEEVRGLGIPELEPVIARGDVVFNTKLPIVDYRLQKGVLDHKLYLGDRWYAMGIGGLHSVDGPGCWKADAEWMLIDIDVASYYPFSMINLNLYPRHWGPEFIKIYEHIVKTRLVAKRSGDKKTADVLKIVINGTYGKTADPYSAMYDPLVTASVTVNGQLALLVLIGMLTAAGGIVVSGNTDGITLKCRRSEYDAMKGVVSLWETLTKYEMEYTEYKAVYQKDVNNYIAVPTDGGLKAKGVFLTPKPGKHDLRHSPNFKICARAVQAYLKDGVPVTDTVRGSTNLQDFIITQQVKGDWMVEWRGQPLGKMVRFYKSNSPDAAPIVRTPLTVEVKGNAGNVAGSESCIPVPDLPNTFPTDIDYQWYIDKANDWITSITRGKKHGLNAQAKRLGDLGLKPTLVDVLGKPTIAKVELGELDFSSGLTPQGKNGILGVCTGGDTGCMALLNEDGSTRCLIQTTNRYPSKTRATVTKQHGITLVFGRSVAVSEDTPVFEEVWFDLDQYYTPAELKKVGR